MVFRVLGVLFAVLVATAATAQTDYRLRPGDVLQIEVLEDPSLNRSALVLPDGSITFPLAGSINAGGLSATQVASAVAQGISPNFATAPTVTVSVSSIAQQAPTSTVRTIDVYLMGQVVTPGLLKVERGTTILQALAQSGGFTKFAATKRIQLRRTDRRTGEQSVFMINYRDIEAGATNIGHSRLADGDVIIVPERRLFE